MPDDPAFASLKEYLAKISGISGTIGSGYFDNGCWWGGPKEFLSWVIESKDKNFKPGTCAKWLEGRLPRPVEDQTQWKTD
jgi:hypothetical protein